MNDRLKFRAWDNENLCWVRPKMVENESGVMVDERGYELFQWTGLYDRDGVEIYKGDIVSIEDDGEWNMNSITNAVVEWDWMGWSPWTIASPQIDVSYIYSSDGKNIKVNGNIYENAELLEG